MHFKQEGTRTSDVGPNPGCGLCPQACDRCSLVVHLLPFCGPSRFPWHTRLEHPCPGAGDPTPTPRTCTHMNLGQLMSWHIPGVLRGDVEPSTQLREEPLSLHLPGRILSTYCALRGQKASVGPVSLARTLRHTARVATVWAVPPNLWGCGHEHALRARPGCTCFASSAHRSGNVLNVPVICWPPGAAPGRAASRNGDSLASTPAKG